ncbi:uncharacterized protein LOC109721554 [Ananas comosus]|uniref:Uncharacterized protein LOC109721554 n=1 Tax=Ananas comosus TaxID=4615 RepID=A0A6P5GHJ9_ANACO|nr:uncharacterized protein LOC109721554 [Ananas comosus]
MAIPRVRYGTRGSKRKRQNDKRRSSVNPSQNHLLELVRQTTSEAPQINVAARDTPMKRKYPPQKCPYTTTKVGYRDTFLGHFSKAQPKYKKNLISLLQPPRILFSLRSNPIAASSPFAQTSSLSSSSSAAATDELGFRRPEFGRKDLAGTVVGGVSAKRRGDDGGGEAGVRRPGCARGGIEGVEGVDGEEDAFVRARSSKLCRWEIFIRREMYLISGVGYSEVFAVAFAVLAAGAIILTVNVLLLVSDASNARNIHPQPHCPSGSTS